MLLSEQTDIGKVFYQFEKDNFLYEGRYECFHNGEKIREDSVYCNNKREFEALIRKWNQGFWSYKQI